MEIPVHRTPRVPRNGRAARRMKNLTPQAKLGIALVTFVLVLAIGGTAYVYALAMKSKTGDGPTHHAPAAPYGNDQK